MAIIYNPETGQYKDDGGGNTPNMPNVGTNQYSGAQGLDRILAAYAAAGQTPSGRDLMDWGSNPSKQQVENALYNLTLLPGHYTGKAPVAPATDPTSGDTGHTGDTGNTGSTSTGPDATKYDTFNAYWDAWPGFDMSAAAAAWNAKHPSDLATVTGHSGDAVTYRGQTWDGITNVGSSNQAHVSLFNPSSGGGGGYGDTPIDPSYLAPFTDKFVPPKGADAPPLPDIGTYTPPPDFSYPDYVAPDAFSYPDFQKPTADSILQDPSFQFRLDQGRGALENSAAARGVLNTGGTLGDVLKFGQNFASQEYGNIFNRDLDAWKTGFSSGLDTWKTNATSGLTDYTTNRANAADAYGVNLDKNFNAFNTNTTNLTNLYNLAKTNSTDAYNHAWDAYLNSQDVWYKNQNNPFDKVYKLGSLGAGAA